MSNGSSYKPEPVTGAGPGREVLGVLCLWPEAPGHEAAASIGATVPIATAA